MSFISQAFGTRTISAPCIMSTLALSGNCTSKQIIAPTCTGPAAVSSSHTGKPSPGVSAASSAKSQVWTFAYRSASSPCRSNSASAFLGPPGQRCGNVTPIAISSSAASSA
jgi:hypothetical protein